MILVTASVANAGGASLDGVTVALHFDRSGLAVAGDATLSVGALEPDESARVQWELLVGEPPEACEATRAAIATWRP